MARFGKTFGDNARISLEKVDQTLSSQYFVVLARIPKFGKFLLVRSQESWVLEGSVAASRKVSPNWSLQTMICHSSHCFSPVLEEFSLRNLGNPAKDVSLESKFR